MRLETVLYESRDGMAHIRLNRPHRLNAMVPQLMRDLHEALQGAANDPEVRVVILSGEGRAFCAGDDLKEADKGYGGVADVRRFITEIQQVTVDMKTMRKPIIAGVCRPSSARARTAFCTGRSIWGSPRRRFWPVFWPSTTSGCSSSATPPPAWPAGPSSGWDCPRPAPRRPPRHLRWPP